MTVIHLRRTSKKTAAVNSSPRVSANVSRIQTMQPIATNCEVEGDFLDYGTILSTDAAINAVDRECINYLSDTQTLELKMLARYSRIREVFVKFITTLPSSAPVDILFGTAGQIKVPRRNHLSDSMFEKLLLMKANHSLF